MTRDIRFRAWDNVENKMIYCGENFDHTFTIEAEGIGCTKTSVAYYGDFSPEPIDMMEHLKYMQYTGLKDREDVGIYEGDIVEINGNQFYISFGIGSFMLVRCSEDICMYENFKSCWNDDVYPLSQYYWESNSEDGTLEDCTIIGQIPFNKFI